MVAEYLSVNYSMNILIKWKLQDRSDWITIYYMLSLAFETDPKAPLTLTLFFKFVIITVVTMIIVLMINNNSNLLLLLLLLLLLFGIS